MNCKFCNAELEEGVTLCPECGRENLEEVVEQTPMETAEEAPEAYAEAPEETDEQSAVEEPTVPEAAPRQKPKPWLVVLAVIGALAIAAVLGIAVYFGISASKAPKSYTVSDAKAASARNTVVATVGDLELTNSQLQVCYQMVCNDFRNYYGSYLDASILDFSKPLDTQFYDEEEGITWQQHFLDNALTSWSRYAALYMQAKEDGFTLDAESQAYLEGFPEQLKEMASTYGFESAEAMLNVDMGPACDVDGYLAYLDTHFYAGQYLDSLYEKLTPTAEEIEAYYLQNEATLNQQGIVNDGSITTDVRHILICPKGGTEDAENGIVYSDEEWEQCRMEAQALLDKWIAEGGTEESFAQLAVEHTEDPGSQSTGGLYTDIRVGQMVEPFEQWCFDESRQYGDTGLVRTSYGYHIMFFVDSREIWAVDVRDTMINARSMAIVEEAVAKWPIDVNTRKIVLGQPQSDTAE